MRRHGFTPARIAGCLLLAGVAAAQDVTVTTTADTVDVDWSTATLADLPGPDGLVSLNEAMIATNNTPGHQTVAFAIPADDPGFGWLLPGRAVFRTVTGFFWRSNDPVTIDGTSQTRFLGDTNPDGNEVVFYGNTFYLNADGSTLLGLDSSSIQVSGSDSLVEGNTGSTNITVFGGSHGIVRDNHAGTIKIDRSDANLIVGNVADRVRILGGGTSDPVVGNVLGGPNPTNRNYITGYGSYNSEGLPAGAAIQLAWNVDTLIENNWIGTTVDGLEQGNPACTMGIDFETENHDITVRNNRIAGILGHGQGPHHAGQLFGWAVYFWGSTSNILLEGNTIGLDANDDPVLGSVWGVNVDNFSGYVVDGVSLVDNVIAGHLLTGVRVGPTATMRLSGTELHSNGGLGIDLVGADFVEGVSPNDDLDADSGGSGMQNHPELTSASLGAGRLLVRGTLDSSPSDDFVIEIFGSSACDDSGHGEGERFLARTDVTTDLDGHAEFVVRAPGGIPADWVVTATATLDRDGATSEFSPCLQPTNRGVRIPGRFSRPPRRGPGIR